MKHRRKKIIVGVLALAAATVAASFALGLTGEDDHAVSGRDASPTILAPQESGYAEGEAAPPPTPDEFKSELDMAAAEEPYVGGADGVDQGMTSSPEPLPPIPGGDGSRVIQNGQITLSIEKGSFDETAERARTIVSASGGFVSSSSASQGYGDERLVRGTFVFRIPASRYADIVSRLSKLGRVVGLDESGQDVSMTYVDLEARERHLEAVERQLLGFLSETETIADALIVQDRLNQTQYQLEEIRGQLRYLDDQTSFATVSLTLGENGSEIESPEPDDDAWGLAEAWQTAREGFQKLVGGLLVAIVVGGPMLILLAALALAAHRRRKRRGEKTG